MPRRNIHFICCLNPSPTTDAETTLEAAASFCKKNEGRKLKDSVYLSTVQENQNLATVYKNSTEINLGPDKYELIANSIEGGKIVGVYNSKTERGPRALGNRSILASAFLPKISKELNRRLKRNDFMPLAPIVREIDANSIFERYSKGLDAAKFVTITLKVKRYWNHKYLM